MSSLFGGNSGFLVTVLYVILFVGSTFIFLFYGQRMQAYTALREVKGGLEKLSGLSNRSKKEALDYLVVNCKVPKDEQSRIEQKLEYFTIMPVDMDPSGLVGKVEHVFVTQDDRMRKELAQMAPQADRIQLSVAQNILEIASSLNQVFKLVRHLFLQSQKTKSYIMVVQLQMIMPMLLQQADALFGSIDTLKQGQPIGDGIGAMIAGKFMQGKPKETLELETVYAKTEYKGRNLLVLKAEGPMAVVGRVHLGVEKLLATNKVKCLIMLDAALKLEGDNTGEIIEGIGAAIGGIGFERFRIEKAATAADIPMYAVVIKESLTDAISVMTKEIAASSEKGIAIIQRIIEEKTQEGDAVLIVGVGNTLGVGQ